MILYLSMSSDEDDKVNIRLLARNEELEQAILQLHVSPGQVSGPGRAVAVWILGHSYVFWAGRYAGRAGWGENLGLGDGVHIDWIGRRGMLWTALLETVRRRLSLTGPPAVLVLHLGGNDLTKMTRVDLKFLIKTDLAALQQLLPNTHLIWSDIVQRRAWRGASSVGKVNRSARKINRAIGKWAAVSGARVIHHFGIVKEDETFYRPDGVHLSDWGMEVWLHDVRATLAAWLEGVGPALVAGRHKERTQFESESGQGHLYRRGTFIEVAKNCELSLTRLGKASTARRARWLRVGRRRFTPPSAP
ncbi:uncharacterized protein LOC143845196 [Paroedura picta]|uniref:uncharacterized protein LOC143845196 n=1 Tax=Paroedura picta TaxID=143630 RepID=UPI0040574C46